MQKQFQIFRITSRILVVFTGLYILACLLIYLNQAAIIFHPSKLSASHQFHFSLPFEELQFKGKDGSPLNGVLFHDGETQQPLVFFLHGNTGNIDKIDGIAQFYLEQGYDFFALDYRGFGKSKGELNSEKLFLSDARIVYRQLANRYSGRTIVIVGYSVGTATAAMLASEQYPGQLVLMAPYYSMEDMAAYKYPFLPSFLVEWKFETFRYLGKVKSPVVLFHGKNDGTIPFHSSRRLASLLKKGDRFIPLSDIGHNNLESHARFRVEMTHLLHRLKTDPKDN